MLLDCDCVQVADIFFGSDAHPHDYLHEVLFRLVSVSWIGAAAQNLVNKVRQYLHVAVFLHSASMQMSPIKISNALHLSCR